MLVPSSALTVVKVLPTDECITILVKTRKKEAHCPVCRTVSRRVQSRYRRILADVPWQGTPVKLQFEVKRFFCDVPDCRRKIFAERLPEVAAPYARQTCRFSHQLQVLGLALGGEAGKRVAGEVGIRTSADQLLRQVIQVPDPPAQTPRALGVDDWAFCRGRNYGTILVDLEKRRVVDLLADRKSETLQAWLEDHPGVEIISRDRASAYAEGAAKGAPEAVQIADRWHVLRNLAEAGERFLTRSHLILKEILESSLNPTQPSETGTSPPELPPHQQQARATQAARQEQRQDRFNQITALFQQGTSRSEIARRFGISRNTVAKYLSMSELPKRKRSVSPLSVLDAYIARIHQCWESGCRQVKQIWAEIKSVGYQGGYGTVANYIKRWCRGPNSVRLKKHHLRATALAHGLSPRRAVWLILGHTDHLTEAEKEIRQKLIDHPNLESFTQLALSFFELLRDRQDTGLEAWLQQALASEIPELVSFVGGIERDKPAVTAAFQYEFSNGMVEGNVNRLKMIKRSMYGRAGFQLLRKRVLLAG